MKPTYYIYRKVWFWGRLYWTGNFTVGKGQSQWAVPQAVTDQQNIGGKECVDRHLWNTTEPGSGETATEINRILAFFPAIDANSLKCAPYEDLPQADKVLAMEKVPEFENSGEPWDTKRYEK